MSAPTITLNDFPCADKAHHPDREAAQRAAGQIRHKPRARRGPGKKHRAHVEGCPFHEGQFVVHIASRSSFDQERRRRKYGQ